MRYFTIQICANPDGDECFYEEIEAYLRFYSLNFGYDAEDLYYCEGCAEEIIGIITDETKYPRTDDKKDSAFTIRCEDEGIEYYYTKEIGEKIYADLKYAGYWNTSFEIVFKIGSVINDEIIRKIVKIIEDNGINPVDCVMSVSRKHEAKLYEIYVLDSDMPVHNTTYEKNSSFAAFYRIYGIKVEKSKDDITTIKGIKDFTLERYKGVKRDG